VHFVINVWGSFTTWFGPKGLSSGNTYIQITENIHWIMVGLHINGIWFVQLIGLHVSVMGVYLDVAFTYRFCDRWKENILFFIPSYLTLLAAVVEVILCRWSVCVCVCVCVRTCVRAWRVGLCFYSNGAKFIFMYYKLFLHKKCSIQKKYWF